jgi:membrane protease YdiL (CAAX protease family)
VLLFTSLAPTVTALIEDFTFRHTLFLKLPVFSRRGVTVLVMVVNALVFGAIHLNNFGGELLLTLSYAGAGLVMNLVYLWTRNIWHVLLMHALNNFILGGPVTVLLVLALQSLVG